MVWTVIVWIFTFIIALVIVMIPGTLLALIFSSLRLTPTAFVLSIIFYAFYALMFTSVISSVVAVVMITASVLYLVRWRKTNGIPALKNSEFLKDDKLMSLIILMSNAVLMVLVPFDDFASYKTQLYTIFILLAVIAPFMFKDGIDYYQKICCMLSEKGFINSADVLALINEKSSDNDSQEDKDKKKKKILDLLDNMCLYEGNIFKFDTNTDKYYLSNTFITKTAGTIINFAEVKQNISSKNTNRIPDVPFEKYSELKMFIKRLCFGIIFLP